MIDLEKSHSSLLNTYARKWVEFDHGKGARLFDTEGKDYIDFGSGIGVNALGYGHQKYTQILTEQISKLMHLSNIYANSIQAELASKLVSLMGDGAVFFSNSGAEANECAIKIARKYGQRRSRDCYEIITLKSSFHGRTIATLKATGQEKYHEHFYPFPDGFSMAKDIKSIYQMINAKTCAVMLELIQGEGGVRAFDKKEIQDLAKMLKKEGILLIVDEIQSGVYRSGKFLASDVYEIKPDIISLAKGLGGGIPIGATFTRLKDIFVPGDHGSTFGGNFLSMRAGLCVLECLEELERSGRLQELSRAFLQNLQAIAKKYSSKFDGVSGLGLMLGLVCKDANLQERIVDKALEQRLLILKAGKNVVRFLPPLLLSNEEMQEGFDRLDKALCAI